MKKCNVVRDLIPLYIDGAASQDSQEVVEMHLSECKPCRDVYQEMREALPDSGVTKELDELDKAAHRMKKRRRRRIWRNVLIGLLLGVLLVVGGDFLRNKLFLDESYLTPFDEYAIVLAQRENGDVYAFNVQEKPRFSTFRIIPDLEQGRYTMFLGSYQSFFPEYFDKKTPSLLKAVLIGTYKDGALYRAAEDGDVRVDELYQGAPGRFNIIYTNGDVIPLCSEELDEYIELQLTDDAIDMNETVTYQEAIEQDKRWNRRCELLKLIPEFQ